MEAADLVRKLEAALYDLDEEGVEIVRADALLRFTQTDAVSHFRNGVLRSVFAPEHVDRVIDKTVQHFGALGLPFRWVVTPSTRPEDMGDRLLTRGFAHLETLHGMIAHPDDFPPPSRADIEVVEIDEGTLEEWVGVWEETGGLAPDEVGRFRAHALRGLRTDPPTEFYFVARMDGVAAGSAALCLIGDFAHFGGASTREAYRGRGLYRELILARMQMLRDRGIGVVTNHCVSTTSAPICARLGFERICDFEVYVHDPSGAGSD